MNVLLEVIQSVSTIVCDKGISATFCDTIIFAIS